MSDHSLDLLEIVISDQLAVNDVVRHVFTIIRHVLIVINTNRSDPFGNCPKGPVSIRMDM
jgi:hypothetical protein